MDKNKVLGSRFLYYAKYLRYLTLICLGIFIVGSLFSSGEDILLGIAGLAIIVGMVSGIQSIVLYVLGKYYWKKGDN